MLTDFEIIFLDHIRAIFRKSNKPQSDISKDVIILINILIYINIS